MDFINLLDGAMGSELISRGERLPEFVWSAEVNLTNPELVYQIHKDYIDAGANYITTNTFRSTPRAYRKTKLSSNKANNKAHKSLCSAIKVANSAAADDKCKVLGSIAPLEDCYSPDLFPGNLQAYKEFLQIANWMVQEKIDGFILETMNSIDETRTCLEAISVMNKPIWVSYYLSDPEHICSGEPLQDAINMIELYPVECILINCNPLQCTYDAVNNIVDNWSGKWGIYPNLGKGHPSPDGIIEYVHSNSELLTVIHKAISFGTSVIGGCCGSSPEHISLISNKISAIDDEDKNG